MKRKLSPRNMFSNLYGCGAQTTRSTRRGPRPGRPRPESAWKKVHALGNLPCSVEETTPKPHRPHTTFSLILSSPLYLSAQHVMFPCRAAAQQQLAAAATPVRPGMAGVAAADGRPGPVGGRRRRRSTRCQSSQAAV